MDKKKILHISKYYFPDEGGIETVAQYLAEGLTDYENRIICYAKNGNTRIDKINGLTVYRIAPSFNIASQDICFSYTKIKTYIKCI